MKITILGTAYPYRGGLSAFNERLARAYMEQGYEVKLITFSLQYPSFLFPGKTQYADQPVPSDLQIERCVNSCNPFNWIKVGRKIKREKPDVLITKFWLPFMAPSLGTIERIVRRNKHTKIVSILDNLIPHEKRLADKLFARYFVSATDYFVAMSRSVLHDLDLFTKNKPRAFCPHPLYDHYGQRQDRNESLRQLHLNPEAKYVLFFGFIRAYKGLDLLLQAFADPRMTQHNINLIVAGEFYEDAQPYLTQIEKLNIADRVVLHTEFIPANEVSRYFSAADLVAQPYKTATQSGVTQIAFHFEKSMLVTNVGGLPEIVPNGKIGFVVSPNANEIAEAILNFFNQNLQETFEQNLREEKKKYEWQRLLETIKSLTNTTAQQ